MRSHGSRKRGVWGRGVRLESRRAPTSHGVAYRASAGLPDAPAAKLEHQGAREIEAVSQGHGHTSPVRRPSPTGRTFPVDLGWEVAYREGL